MAESILSVLGVLFMVDGIVGMSSSTLLVLFRRWGKKSPPFGGLDVRLI